MKFRTKKHREAPQIDMSPLIDMVFILLIFFMVSTTFVKDMQLEIERPGAASAAPASSEALRVYVDRHGGLYLDGHSIHAWMLQSGVRRLLARNASSQVLVVVDKRVAAEKLIQVVDQCRLAGAEDVGVVTKQQ
jgi:biopolymer transport protein ExbD